MKNYLFLPITNISGRFTREPALNDGYILDGIAAFKAVNPDNHLKKSDKSLSWEEKQIDKLQYDYGEYFQGAVARLVGNLPKCQKVKVGTLRSTRRKTQLNQLSAGDVLFVIGHGNFSAQYITRKHVYEKDKKSVYDGHMISGTTLAAMLDYCGLPRNHKWIKLNTCFGGGSEAVIPFSEVSLQGSAVLARALAVALGARGFNNIHVGGYNFMTSHDDNAVQLIGIVKGKYAGFAQALVIPSTRLEDAYKPRYVTFEEDPHRIWYNAEGRMVRWNEPDLGEFYRKVEMLDAEKYPEWAEHQKRVREWEALLEQKGLG